MISHEEWDDVLKQTAYCAFQQAWAYGEIFVRANLEVNRFVAFDQGEIIAIGQVITRRYAKFFKFSLLLQGPIWLKDISNDQRKFILQNIRDRYPLKNFNLFAFSPAQNPVQNPVQNLEKNDERELYEQMGFRQIITGGSTVLIDLRLSEDQLWQNLYGKNRTDIRKAEKNDLEVIFSDHNHIYADWLLKKENKQQKEKKYQGLPAALSKSYGEYSSPDQGVYTAFAVEKGAHSPLAGIVILRHGNAATYHIGWNGREGRKRRALNFLLWQMMLKLKQSGVQIFDLGGINTAKGADIARFKLSFGGDVTKVNGTFM